MITDHPLYLLSYDGMWRYVKDLNPQWLSPSPDFKSGSLPLGERNIKLPRNTLIFLLACILCTNYTPYLRTLLMLNLLAYSLPRRIPSHALFYFLFSSRFYRLFDNK